MAVRTWCLAREGVGRGLFRCEGPARAKAQAVGTAAVRGMGRPPRGPNSLERRGRGPGGHCACVPVPRQLCALRAFGESRIGAETRPRPASRPE